MNPLRMEPCARCGVRADVGCKHRPAAGDRPPAIASPDVKPDGRGGARPGNGHNFHRNKAPTASIWGKEGNPTERQFASLAVAFTTAMKPRSKDPK